MKKVKKKIELNLQLEELSIDNYMCGDRSQNVTYKYSVNPNEFVDLETLECFVEIEEPETLKEWLDKNKMPKKALLDWLIKNYK
jgi:hypothetical protein